MSIYLTTVTRPSVVTPTIFVEHGIKGQMPACPSDVDIVKISSVVNPTYEIFRSMHPMSVRATIHGRITSTTKREGNLLTTSLPAITSDPITFGFNLSGGNIDSFTTVAKSLGFTLEKSVRSSYYRGEVSDIGILRTLAKYNIDMDSNVPIGVVNPKGLLAFEACQKFLFAVASSIPFPSRPYGKNNNFRNTMRGVHEYSLSDENGETFEVGYTIGGSPPTTFLGTDVPLKKSHSKVAQSIVPRIFYGTPSMRVPIGSIGVAPYTPQSSHGYFFGYFQGMILTDPAPLRHLIDSYQELILPDPENLESYKALRKGVKSLASTEKGQEFTHMAYCLNLGLQSGLMPTFVFDESRVYKGTLLEGTDVKFMKDSVLIDPLTSSQLNDLFNELNVHKSNLTALARILSGIPPDGMEKAVEVTVHDLTTPRSIHYHLADRTISGAQDHAEILNLVKGLTFKQTFWKTSDTGMLLRALDSIVDGRRLPDSEPFVLRGPHIFTKDITLSTMYAFGLRAPAIQDLKKGNKVCVIPQSGSPLPNDLPDIPVFMRGTQQAAKDWDSVLRDQLFRYTRDVKGRFPGSVKKLTKEEKTKVYVTIAMASSQKKRKGKDNEVEQEEPKKKKMRMDEPNSLLVSLFGKDVFEDGEDDASMDE